MKVDRKDLLARATKALERIEAGLLKERDDWDAWRAREEQADKDLGSIAVANGEMCGSRRAYRGYNSGSDDFDVIEVSFRVAKSALPAVEPAPESKYQHYDTTRVKQLISILKLTSEEKVTVTAKMLDAIVLLEDEDGNTNG